MEIVVIHGSPPQTPANHCRNKSLEKRMKQILCLESRRHFRELYQQFLDDPHGYAMYSYKKKRKKFNSSAMYFASLFTEEDFSYYPTRRKSRKCYQASYLSPTNTPCDFLLRLIKEGFSVSSMDLRYLLIEDNDLSKSNFTGSDFSGSLFVNCDFNSSNLAFVDFSNAVFVNCTFKDADLRGANFSWALLDSDTVRYLDIKTCYGPYFIFDLSSKRNAIHPDCKGIDYRTNIYGDFISSQKDAYYGKFYEGLNFSRRLKKRKYVILDSSVKHCSFKNQDLRDSYFEGCIFEGCDFSGALVSEKTFGQFNKVNRFEEQTFSKVVYKRRPLEKYGFEDINAIFKDSPNLLSHSIDEMISIVSPIRRNLAEIPEKRSVLLSIEGQIKFIVESNLGIKTDGLQLSEVQQKIINDARLFDSNAIESELKKFDKCFEVLRIIRNKYSHSEYRELVDYLKVNNHLKTKKFLKKDEGVLKYIVNVENCKYTGSSQAIKEDDLLAAVYLYAFFDVGKVKSFMDDFSQSLIPLKEHILKYASCRDLVNREIKSLCSSTCSLALDQHKNSLKDANSAFKRELDKATLGIYKSIQIRLKDQWDVKSLKPSEKRIKSIIRERIKG